MNAEEKSRYFQELTLNLQCGGFTVGLEADGILPVELDSQRLCQITDSGGVRYWKEDVASDRLEVALDIQHDSAALPNEMVAAAVYLENGSTSQDAAEMASAGQLMCFHWPKNTEELSPLALCILTEGGHSRSFYTLHFGEFEPDMALRSAQQYAHDRQISVTDALLSLTTDMVLDSDGGARKILVSNDPDMAQALSNVFGQCAAVAAQISIDADQGQTAVEYNPLWLKLRQQQEQAQGRSESMERKFYPEKSLFSRSC